MKKFKPGYYTADTVNGVEYDNDYLIDNPDGEIISPDVFFEWLPVVKDGETIATYIDHEGENIWSDIERVYGITG